MAQLQNLVLKDRKAATRTFVPRDIRNGVGEVVETTGVPVGESRYSISLRKTPTGRYKATIKFVNPIVQDVTVNGVTKPEVVRTAFATLDFDFAPTSTTLERDNFVGMLESSLAKTATLVDKTLINLEGVY